MQKQTEETPLLRLLPMLQKLVSLSEVHKLFGVTKSQILIFVILHYRGSMTMSEVAKYLSSSKEQATRTVSVLFEQGLIERFEKESNRTHVYIRLTKLGQEFMQRLVDELNFEVSQKLISSLSSEDLETLYQSVHTAVEILNKVQI